MEHILANYSDERIREFADEGEEGHRDHAQPVYCADCGDIEVDQQGRLCVDCGWESAQPPAFLPSNLYAAVMQVCAQVLDPNNENVKQWDVLACVRDVAQMAMASKKEAA